MTNKTNKIYISLLFTISLWGADIQSLPSYQGFRGVVNTPNSEVIHEGEFEFLYNNQVNNFYSSSNFNDFRNKRKEDDFF